LLKLNGNEWGENEIALYKLAGSERVRLPMLIPCYAGEYDAKNGNSYLLLQDLSETHEEPVSRKQLIYESIIPSEAHLRQMIEALAGFHAYWWQHTEFGQPGSLTQVRWYRDKPHFREHIERRKREFSQFEKSVGSEVPPAWLELYRLILAKLPQLWETYFEPRVLTFKNITLSNGDAYVNQYLCPKADLAGRTYLVDFQDAGANFGAFDLVYLMATFWTPAQRHHGQREENLLRYYLEILQVKGVQNYSWNELLTDYKLMVLIVMLVPVWDQTNGSPKSYWWPKMQCLSDNFQDLNCSQLFEWS
jgi:hypothetical protein